MNLEAIRKAKGISAYRLAALIGTQCQNVRNWERGKVVPGRESLQKISAALGCSIDEIAGTVTA